MNKTNYFDNIGGLNTADTPFKVADNQATNGYNYEYTVTGGIAKIRGKELINTTADAQLVSLGLGLYYTAAGSKSVIRAAGTKIQLVNTDAETFTNQAEDTTTATTNFLNVASTQPVSNQMFTGSSANVLWLAGGGMTSIYGYTGSNITQNGVAEPSGSFTVTTTTSGGSFTTAGTLWYSLALRKTSTQAIGNAALDQTITLAASTNSAVLTFPVGVDTAKYDKWYVYRSAFSGVEDFTTGTLVAQVDTTDATYTDVGNVAVATSQVVPRAGNTTDNSVLPSGTYKYLTTYKNQLVTVKDSTVYFSDLNKSESWPLDKTITVPSGGEITGISSLGFSAPFTSNLDEYLVIFKEQEMWVVTGSGFLDSDTGIYDFNLRFVDQVGCESHMGIVKAQGAIFWYDGRGIYAWTGSGKPIYVSSFIEDKFGQDGDLDKANLYRGWGVFFQIKNQIIWTLPHRTLGLNKYRIKLDTRITVPQITNSLQSTVMPGVFIQDRDDTSLYSGFSYRNDDNSDVFIVGDGAGYIYYLLKAATNNGENIEFAYDTKIFDMGSPGTTKTFQKVVVWVDESVSKKLSLYYWSNYRTSDDVRSQIMETMEDSQPSAAALWDIAYWDVAYWDEYTSTLKGIVFNLNGRENNNVGDSLKLRFTQIEESTPVVIHGFTIYYTEHNSLLRK